MKCARMVLACSVLFGCGQQVSELAPGITTTSTTHPLAATIAADAAASAIVPGFVFAPSASSFRLGANQHTVQAGTMMRLVGDEGAIATTASGATISVPNAGAPSTVAAPYSTNPAVHTQHVLAYFQGAGLPADQIGDTHITTKMAGGAPTASSTTAVPQLVGYTTIVDRKVQGIRIAGSYAWARFNANDEVVAEEVFWPPIDASVLNDAMALQTTMSASSSQGPFVAALPPEVSALDTEVVIHHSPAMIDTVGAFASVDFQGRSAPETRSFAADGTEKFASMWWPAIAGTPKPSH